MTPSTTARALREAAPLREMPSWTLGERLRKIRRQLGIGQQEFAEQLGENRKTYAAWELDTNCPRNVVAVARRIELLTGFPATWTLGLGDAQATAEAAPVSPAVPAAAAVTEGEPASVVPATRRGRGPDAEKWS